MAGYAAGVRTIHIDTMGASDTLYKDYIFTIASDGSGTKYRLTEDTTLATNEGDITFTPGLAEAVADNDVVTFENSTLTLPLEPLFIKLVAARAAKSMAAKFVNAVPKGGPNTWKDFLTLGQTLENEVIPKLEREARKYQKPVSFRPRAELEATT